MYRSHEETSQALEELDIIQSPLRRERTQTIPPYIRMKILQRFQAAKQVYEEEEIPDEVWTLIADVDCSIRSAKRFCKVDGRLEGITRGGQRFEKVTSREVVYFIGLLCMSNRTAKLSQYVLRLQQDLGINVSKNSVSRILIQLKLKFKVATRVKKAKFSNENMMRMTQYINDIFDLDWTCVKFMDETGIDRRNCGRRRARGFPGERVSTEISMVHGNHFTVAGIIGVDPQRPCLAYNIMLGADTFDTHEEFILQQIQNGFLAPGDVLICDNYSVYVKASEDLNAFLASLGIAVMPLPCYMAEWNPIEYNWNTFKTDLYHGNMLYTDAELIERVTTFMENVKHETILNYYAHVWQEMKSVIV